MFNDNLVKTARDKAETFLIEEYLHHGWCDFLTPIGQSDEWVCAYVAVALGCDHPEIFDRKKVVSNLIEKQRHSGGWAYNARAPADADSTAITLKFLARNHALSHKQNHKARNFLAKHQHADGGISTFRSSLSLRLLMQAFKVSFKGWLQSHVCVTAAALEALINSGMGLKDPIIVSGARYLHDSVDPQTGLWPSYWWQGPYYSSAAALRIFSLLKQTPRFYQQRIESITSSQLSCGAWGLTPESHGSTFATALAVEILINCSIDPGNPCIVKALNWLLGQQESNGSWPTEPILRIPHPYDMQPEDNAGWRINSLGTGVLIQDQNRLFTTATILALLKRLG